MAEVTEREIGEREFGEREATEREAGEREAGEREFGEREAGEREATDLSRAPVAVFEDFEQRRVLASVRRRLFGRAPTLSIGRYRVEGRLGAGGMGEVYLAIDETLQRKVAIKRVRADLTNTREQERLRREALALARLSHPNVVQVYEIGDHEGQTFIAMECVEGTTLAAWLAAAPRDWAAILERFLAAGRGLAAAHRAGLTHRDFKPENVLIDGDGHPRVADFGLVLTSEEPPEGQGRAGEAGVAEATTGQLPAAALRLSATGAMLGTLRYMSLEQLTGQAVDARGDQFSFCLALYEALWGRSPFPFDSVRDRVEALERGAPTAPPRSSAPIGLWPVIRRGLASTPAQRWPDMDALLAALARVPRRRRRLFGVAAASLGVVTLLAVTVAVLGREPAPLDPCAEVDRELQGLWDGPRREQIAAALDARVGAAIDDHLAESRARVLAGLDDWASSWTDARAQSCRALADHTLAPAVAAARDHCLDRQRRRVAALIDRIEERTEFESASEGAELLARAVEIVVDLPPPVGCADAQVSLGIEAPPRAIAAAVEVARGELDRAHELRLLGRVDEARDLAQATLATALELDHGPLIAEARAELGKAELTAGSLARGVDELRSAVDLAEIHHHDQLAADLWIELALRTAIDLGDAEGGAWDLRRATIADQRAPHSSPRSRARLAFARARLLEAGRESDEAEAALREALALLEDDAVEGAAADRPSYQVALARLLEARDPEGALALVRAARDSAAHHYGDAHPRTAGFEHQLGETLLRLGHADEATAALERAVAIWTSTHARPHRDLARAERTLAQLALRRGDLDGAQVHALAQARVQAEILPADHVDHGEPEMLLAHIEGVRGARAAALGHCRAALDLWEPKLAPDDGRISRARGEAASHLLALGRFEEAEVVYRQALAHGAPATVLAAQLGLAEIGLHRGRPQEAAASLAAIDALLLDAPTALGGQELSLALLRAVTDLRQGQLRAGQVEALAVARARSPITEAQLAAWLDELGLAPRERRALEL